MFAPRDENQKRLFPHIRLNKHFRIKSASKDKIVPFQQFETIKSRRKDVVQETKRILSENRSKKYSSLQTSIKLKIATEELEPRFVKSSKTNLKKNPIYESVKTEDNAHIQQRRVYNSHTVHHDENQINLSKSTKVCNPNQILSNLKSNFDNKWCSQPQKFKKIKNQKEHKGKYRCRVNQFVFDNCRKKTGFNKQQQQSLNQFWKNVNESLILPANQQEQLSKDLQQFVEHFVTQ